LRWRKRVLVLALLAGLGAAAVFGLKTWRERGSRLRGDTAFVSVPAWPKPEARPAPPKPTLASKDYLLQVGSFASKDDAEEMAGRLTGLAWPVGVVVPVSANDTLRKVIVRGISDIATARRVADSLGEALQLKVTIIEPTGTRSK
jgi:cell division protein FtsN